MDGDALLGLTTMTTTGCLPCQQRAADSTAASATRLAAETPSAAPADSPVTAYWSGVIGVEGELTGDGRLIEHEALRWEDLPIPLRHVSSDMGAHDGAVVVGHITAISRGSEGAIEASGDFDMNSPYGVEAERQVREGLTNGVSMDLDDVSFEVRIAAELLEGGDDGMMMPLLLAADGDGGDDADSLDHDEQDDDPPSQPEPDADGRVTVMEINADDEVRVTTSGRIRAATIVAIPAFSTAQIHLSDMAPVEVDVVTRAEAIVASAVPHRPPAAWFNRPTFTEPTPLTISQDGRVYGHLAQWETCHITPQHGSSCVKPPHSNTGYAHFHTGAVLTAEGAEVPIGHLTLDTTHAGDGLTAASAAAHYEHTGHVVADVAAGEDAWGIWVAGALRPSITAHQLRALRAAPLSGDWRRIGGSLELVAALAVNVPGYSVPRPSGRVHDNQVTSLVASGMVAPRRVIAPGHPGALSTDDLRYLKRLADRERTMANEQAATLARRVQATTLAMRVRRARLPRAS